jgi:hypothetical protein
MSNGDDLLKLVVAGSPGLDPGVVANELLREFHRGYPIEHLRGLLRSEVPSTVKAGMWITSELGQKGALLLDDVAPLLNSQFTHVRYFAIDSILSSAGQEHAAIIAKVPALLHDAEQTVRLKVVDFFRRASEVQLSAAADHLGGQGDEGRAVAARIRRLLDPAKIPAEGVVQALRSVDELNRRFAAAHALRAGRFGDDLLAAAAASEDHDLRELARYETEDQERRAKRDRRHV